ncbi:hypothetical protein FOA52_001583 [Chlamydomonas sp. UWO 241]|nr:hypothetical protein FOA52_001583 [Chlamydomonas sp. UWO 241]
MPARKGTKFPMFPHKDDSWTWSAFWDFLEADLDSPGSTVEEYDFCVLLRELCVVDIDDLSLCAELEKRFPELLDSAAIALTARGRHYYFRRPHIADEHGYYDGAAQRVKGIDFKSVCRTGTSGIVLVPPSTGKRWARIKLARITEMPVALLHEVAVPHHARICRTVSFSCGGTLRGAGGMWTCAMSYFDMFAEFADTADVVVPCPCEMSHFRELMHIMDHGRVDPSHPPSASLLRDVLRAADVLGLAQMQKLTHQISAGIPWLQLELYRAHPAWFEALYSDETTRWVVEIDAATAATVVYERVAFDRGRWLYPSIRKLGAPFRCGDRVLERDPVAAATAAMPAEVVSLLLAFPGKVAAAGGAVLGAIALGAAAGTDVDLFIVTNSMPEAAAILDAAAVLFDDPPSAVSRYAVTFRSREGRDVQIVLRRYRDLRDVVWGFDIQACMVMLTASPRPRSLSRTLSRSLSRPQVDLHLWATPAWVEAVRCMAFAVDFTLWSTSSISRLHKYVSKGFDVFLPGVQPSVMRELWLERANGSRNIRTLAALLVVEREYMRESPVRLQKDSVTS